MMNNLRHLSLVAVFLGIFKVDCIMAQTSVPRVPTELAAGSEHAGAIDSLGRLITWGSNAAGQLGRDPVNGDGSIPGPVNGIGEAELISFSASYSMAVNSFGRLYTWGLPGPALGRGEAATAIPELVGSLLASDITAISAGETHAAAVSSSGRLFIWGENSSGQLGNGSRVARSVPIEVTGKPGDNVTGWRTEPGSVACGLDFTLAIDDKGRLFGWGLHTASGPSLGPWNGFQGPFVERPALLSTYSDWVAVETGLYHSLALRGPVAGGGTPDPTDDVFALYVWGRDIRGLLAGAGGPSIDDYRVAIPDSASAGWKFISAGGSADAVAPSTGFSLAVDGNNRLWGWGENLQGQLNRISRDSDGRLLNGYDVLESPVRVDQVPGLDSSTYSDRLGALPNVSFPGFPFFGSSTPVAPAWSEVAAGGNFFIGLTDSPSLFAAGDNQVGQFGNGEIATSEMDYAVLPLPTVSSVNLADPVDLSISSVFVPSGAIPNRFATGADIKDYRVSVRNNLETTYVDGFTVSVYFSIDDVYDELGDVLIAEGRKFDRSDTPLDTEETPNLGSLSLDSFNIVDSSDSAVNPESDPTLLNNIPQGLGLSDLFLIFVVRPISGVSDFDFSNNTFAQPVSISNFDLAPTGITLSGVDADGDLEVVGVETNFSATLTVSNEGLSVVPTGAKLTVELFVSEDEVLDSEDDIQISSTLATDGVGGVVAGATRDFIINSLSIPGSVRAGNYFLLAQIGTSTSGENDTTNNLISIPVRVDGVDLAFEPGESGLSVSDVTQDPPATTLVDFDLVVENSGGGKIVRPVVVRAYISRDEELNLAAGGEIQLQFVDGTTTVSELSHPSLGAAGAADSNHRFAGKLNFTTSASGEPIRPGSYELFFVVDPQDSVVETDETNNFRQSTLRVSSDEEAWRALDYGKLETRNFGALPAVAEWREVIDIDGPGESVWRSPAGFSSGESSSVAFEFDTSTAAIEFPLPVRGLLSGSDSVTVDLVDHTGARLTDGLGNSIVFEVLVDQRSNLETAGGVLIPSFRKPSGPYAPTSSELNNARISGIELFSVAGTNRWLSTLRLRIPQGNEGFVRATFSKGSGSASSHALVAPTLPALEVEGVEWTKGSGDLLGGTTPAWGADEDARFEMDPTQSGSDAFFARVFGPALVEFDYVVSSADILDQLRFTVDGEFVNLRQVASDFGKPVASTSSLPNANGSTIRLLIESGEHILRWEAVKQSVVGFAAAVNNLRVTTPIPSVIDPGGLGIPGPDLAIETIDIPDGAKGESQNPFVLGALEGSGMLQINELVIRNFGADLSNFGLFDVQFRLSPDAFPDFSSRVADRDPNDIILGSSSLVQDFNIAGISAEIRDGDLIVLTGGLELPLNIADGTYYLIVVVNAQGLTVSDTHADEFSFANNVVVIPGFEIERRPEIEIEAIALPSWDNVFFPAMEIPVDIEVRNTGLAPIADDPETPEDESAFRIRLELLAYPSRSEAASVGGIRTGEWSFSISEFLSSPNALSPDGDSVRIRQTIKLPTLFELMGSAGLVDQSRVDYQAMTLAMDAFEELVFGLAIYPDETNVVEEISEVDDLSISGIRYIGSTLFDIASYPASGQFNDEENYGHYIARYQAQGGLSRDEFTFLIANSGLYGDLPGVSSTQLRNFVNFGVPLNPYGSTIYIESNRVTFQVVPSTPFTDIENATLRSILQTASANLSNLLRGTTISGLNTTDFDSDGIPNFLEYAFGTSPVDITEGGIRPRFSPLLEGDIGLGTQPLAYAVRLFGDAPQDDPHLTVTFDFNNAAEDLIYYVFANNSLSPNTPVLKIEPPEMNLTNFGGIDDNPAIVSVTGRADSGLLNTYTVRVDVKDELILGNSPRFMRLEVHTRTRVPPVAASILEGSRRLADVIPGVGEHVFLEWDETVEYGAWVLERADLESGVSPTASVPAALFQPLTTVNGDVTSFRDDNIQSTRSYAYRIRPINILGAATYRQSLVFPSLAGANP